EHVVLERGRTVERWRSERWDSLRLLTPNWMTRLPGWSYTGPDPDGFMTADEVVSYLAEYARASAAPVEEGQAEEPLRLADGRVQVVAASGRWRAANVVLATGWCDRPAVPAAANRLDPGIFQLSPSDYRNPDSLPPGGVLIVGASSSGVQMADELA